MSILLERTEAKTVTTVSDGAPTPTYTGSAIFYGYFFGGVISILTGTTDFKSVYLYVYDEDQERFYYISKTEGTGSIINVQLYENEQSRIRLVVDSDTDFSQIGYTIYSDYDVIINDDSTQANNIMQHRQVFYDNTAIETKNISIETTKENISTLRTILGHKKVILDGVEYIIMNHSLSEFDNLDYEIPVTLQRLI